MSRLTRLCALITLGLMTPFAAWGLGADISDAPDIAAGNAGSQAVFDLALPPGVEPPACALEGMGEGAEDNTGESAVACCWVWYAGRWWCVYC